MKTSPGLKFDPAKVSQCCRDANPHIFDQAGMPRPAPESESLSAPKRRGKRRREMNATEREFAAYLQRLMDANEIISFDYEGMTLRWGTGAALLSYTADFVAVHDVTYKGYPPDLQSTLPSHPFVRLVFYEIKGAHAWKADIVRFKAAKAAFPLYEFQLWEKAKDHGWCQTI